MTPVPFDPTIVVQFQQFNADAVANFPVLYVVLVSVTLLSVGRWAIKAMTRAL